MPAAFADAAGRRKRGERFGAAVFLDDRRARCALFVAAPLVLAQVTDFDERARVLDAVATGGLVIGGRTQAEIECYDSRYIRTALEVLLTADTVVTRSATERERLGRIVGRRFSHMAEVAPLDVTVPLRTPGSADAIVVWAPDYPAEACGLLAYALEEFRRPAFVICGSGQAASMRASTRFVPLSQAADALSQASVIVDASLGDPGSARALASWNVPLAAASCSGALDWLDGITTYDPWNHRSISAAVANALGNGTPQERRPGNAVTADLERSLAHATPRPMLDAPLVSIVVPTMNRRDSLHAALASIVGQTYSPLEILVVNDGGPPLGELAPDGPLTPLIIEYPDNRGVSAAVNIGINASHGKYIAILADDDLFCPDHIAQLVAPLERTGGQIAHAIELGEHFESASPGTFRVVGHSLVAGEPAQPTVLQTVNVIGGPAILFSRTAFDRVGPFDERAAHLMDLEMWLRMSEAFDFVHVERVTAVMSMRDDQSQASAISGLETAACYRTIYSLHPSSRSSIVARREMHLASVESLPIVQTLPQLRLLDG